MSREEVVQNALNIIKGLTGVRAAFVLDDEIKKQMLAEEATVQGAGGYTVMVRHKDNSLERYNLHGQKPEGWKGIRAPETVKDLPELIQV